MWNAAQRRFISSSEMTGWSDSPSRSNRWKTGTRSCFRSGTSVFGTNDAIKCNVQSHGGSPKVLPGPRRLLRGRSSPEVDAALDREFVDSLQLVGAELQVVERVEVRIELLDAARSEQHR